MSTAAAVAAQMALATLATSVAHEATHAGVAAACGRLEGFSVRRWEVDYRGQLPPGRTEYAIASAPLVVGLAVAPLLWWLRVPIWAWVPWGVYTLQGAITNDFAFRETAHT